MIHPRNMIQVHNIPPQEVYSANILPKPEGAVSIFALFTERGWNNEFIYHVKPYYTCAVTSSAFKIAVIFREYRGMARKKISKTSRRRAGGQ